MGVAVTHRWQALDELNEGPRLAALRKQAQATLKSIPSSLALKELPALNAQAIQFGEVRRHPAPQPLPGGRR